MHGDTSEITYTWTTVLDGLVRARELSEVVANHFRLNFDGVEDLYEGILVVKCFLYDYSCGNERTFPL